jgi:bis(5'-nucleosyl)-tetraphosphatase (symmetrical)
MGIEKTAIISDVHGCRVEFEELLNLVDYKSPYVRVILVGDLIDRGPQSLEVVQLARQLKLECVLGNHDLKFLKWYNNKGGRSDTYDKHSHYTQFSKEDITYISQMPLYIKIPEHRTVVVHAGLRAGVPLEKQTRDDLCYIRYLDDTNKFVSLKKINQLGSKEAAGAHFWTQDGPFGYNVVYGHQVWEEPRIDRFEDGTVCYGIDTGCCFGKKLSAIILETKEIIQVSAKRIYYKSTFDVR